MLVLALLTIFALATPLSTHQETPANITNTVAGWPSSYIALGDSYATGNGAGKLVGNRKDKRVRYCKRFSASYPEALKKLLLSVKDEDYQFAACSGAVLDNIDTAMQDRYGQDIMLNSQIENLSGQKADVVTLSIVGNDLSLYKVVLTCLYNHRLVGSKTDFQRDKECNSLLDHVENRFDDPNLWETYRQKVRTIIKDVLSTGVNGSKNASLLVILGYPKLFGKPEDGDACMNLRLPIHVAGIRIKTNILRPELRQRLNDYIDRTNDRISKEVLAVDPKRIRFVSVDDVFEGHRVCEHGFKPKTRDKYEPVGANDGNVWFYSLESKMEEKKKVVIRNLDESWLFTEGDGVVGEEGEHDFSENDDSENDDKKDAVVEKFTIRSNLIGPSSSLPLSTLNLMQTLL